MFTSGRLALAERYAAWLADDGVVRGLIGPREAPRLWERHLLNCAVLGEAVPAGARVADLGSGAGLPGLVLAIARPDVHVTLVEPLLRRTTFLEEVCADLAPHGLDNVSVVRGRAEALHGERTFDVVTARALAPLERLLGWGMPLVAPHGALVAMKGSSAGEEIEAAAPVLHRLRCTSRGARARGRAARAAHPGGPGGVGRAVGGRLALRPRCRSTGWSGHVERQEEATALSRWSGRPPWGRAVLESGSLQHRERPHRAPPRVAPREGSHAGPGGRRSRDPHRLFHRSRLARGARLSTG